jgi:hypothetical protein
MKQKAVACAMQIGRRPTQKPNQNLPSFSSFPSVQIVFKPSVHSDPAECHLHDGNWSKAYPKTQPKFTFVFFVSFCSNSLQTFCSFGSCRMSPARWKLVEGLPKTQQNLP